VPTDLGSLLGCVARAVVTTGGGGEMVSFGIVGICGAAIVNGSGLGMASFGTGGSFGSGSLLGPADVWGGGGVGGTACCCAWTTGTVGAEDT
jgi:hypothetical protein